MIEEKHSNQSITQLLTSLEQEKFTGCLDVESNTGIKWRIYICLSKLIWADGGIHPLRSWRRLLLKYCSKVNPTQVVIENLNKYECWNYYILTQLVKSELIEDNQAEALIESKITEVIFDILHEEESGEKLSFKFKPLSTDALMDAGLKLASVVTLKQAISIVKQERSAWRQRGFSIWSPNQAPIIKQPDKLKNEVSTVVYENFNRLFNGKLTLRDLAVKLNQDVFKITSSISSYILSELIGLIQIPDISASQTPFKVAPAKSQSNQEVQPKTAPIITPTKITLPPSISLKELANKPLIACIDDSPQIHQIMNQILAKAGYRFIGIKDALQAVPTLISSNPDFVFLDLTMPILNGYEILTQIRRVSKLQNIPVVILTSKDGIVDRMRSKLGGASGFLGKPIEEEKVLSMIKNLLEENKIE